MFGCGSVMKEYTDVGFYLLIMVPMLFRLVVLGVIIYLVFKIFKGDNIRNRNSVKILHEKYANGDISFEEYQKRKDNIKNKRDNKICGFIVSNYLVVIMDISEKRKI